MLIRSFLVGIRFGSGFCVAEMMVGLRSVKIT